MTRATSTGRALLAAAALLFAGTLAVSLQAEPGKISVEITAPRIIPGKFDKSNGTPEPVGEMYIPKKYNANTTLSAEVTPDGENQIPFVLASN